MLPFIPYATDRSTRRRAYATYSLLVLNVLVYLGTTSLGGAKGQQAAVAAFGFIPDQGHWYSAVTSAFMHANLSHLVSNMIFLWVFGSLVEDALGAVVFLIFYLGSQLGANLLHVIIARPFTHELPPLIGASGAVAGLMGLVAVRFQRTKIKVWCVRVFEVSAMVFVACWLGWELYWGLTWVGYAMLGHGSGGTDHVAHWAHVGGFVFGMLGAMALSMRQEGRQEYMLEQLKRNPLAFSGYDVAKELEVLAGERRDDPEVHHALARQHMLARRPQAAGKMFMRATGLYLRNGDEKAAADTYSELLACFPECVLPLADQFGIACALEKVGKYGLALQAFDKLSNSYPHTSEAEVALIRAGQLCTVRLGNPRLAVRFFTSLLEQYPGTSWRQFAEKRIEQLNSAGGGSLEGPGRWSS